MPAQRYGDDEIVCRLQAMKTATRAAMMKAVLCGLILFVIGPDVNAAEVVVKKYTYKTSGGKPRGIEVVSPEDHDPATKRTPGIILFHGGNWTDGSPAEFHDVCRHFAGRGLVAATVDYRMLLPYGPEKDKDPETGLTRKQVCVRDAKSAIRWFKEYADALGVDPARIVAGGGSAGGHIAVLASTTPDLDDPTDPPGIDTSVAAYMLWAPACTEADANDPPIDARRHVGKNFAPAVVFFGTEDSWLRHWKNLTQYSIRPRGGAEPVVWYAQGGDHGVFGKQDWRAATIAAADRFLVDRGFLVGESNVPVSPGGKTLTPVAADTAK
jgi:acetyl esterase